MERKRGKDRSRIPVMLFISNPRTGTIRKLQLHRRRRATPILDRQIALDIEPPPDDWFDYNPDDFNIAGEASDAQEPDQIQKPPTRDSPQ
jgi:hypothetical protein